MLISVRCSAVRWGTTTLWASSGRHVSQSSCIPAGCTKTRYMPSTKVLFTTLRFYELFHCLITSTTYCPPLFSQYHVANNCLVRRAKQNGIKGNHLVSSLLVAFCNITMRHQADNVNEISHQLQVTSSTRVFEQRVSFSVSSLAPTRYYTRILIGYLNTHRNRNDLQ